MKILAFGASNSKQSINQQLATWAVNQIEGADITIVDINDFEMPIYSIDRENESGIPELAQNFKSLVNEADGIIISFAEHNGSYSTAFKNIFDWMSRLGSPIWSDKPMFLLATSPGGRGGASVLETAQASLPHRGGNVSGAFSLPSFEQNFMDGIRDETLLNSFLKQRDSFVKSINKID